MTTIADWAERPQPIESVASLEAARRRFLEEPGVSALVVIEDELPIGVLSRAVVMSVDERTSAKDSPVTHLMARVRSMPADTPGADALAALLDGGCVEGVIVTRDSAYAGVVTQASLLQALKRRMDQDSGRSEDQQRFVEVLSREIRTPMMGVMAVADLLRRQPLSTDAQAYVQTIVDSSTSLIRLLDDAVDLSLGERGRLEPRPEPVQLRALMDDIQNEWLDRNSADVAVLVSYDGDPDLGVHADGMRIKQVFGALIGSALKTTRKGAVEASLVARAGEEGVHLIGRVRDAGPGLPAEQLARIFEPTAPGADWARASWTGLGPALCRRVIEAMNGAIRADSNVGEGVTVTFELMAPRVEVESDEQRGQLSQPGGAIHVLVVDDNATNRMVAEGLCEMFDCTTECAEDGVEAVEAAKSGRFDLILMDIKMPRMDGVEATKAIRALAGSAGKVPIIALTANADPEDAKDYLACGMSSVVEKPIKPERLLAAMNAALERGEDGSVRAA
jgi:signal transduction histidine kinase/ActR/RegA family two-component response regulator